MFTPPSSFASSTQRAKSDRPISKKEFLKQLLQELSVEKKVGFPESTDNRFSGEKELDQVRGR